MAFARVLALGAGDRCGFSRIEPYANRPQADAALGCVNVVRAGFWHWRVLILALAFLDRIALFRLGGVWTGSNGEENETEVWHSPQPNATEFWH
jgi:hypothetical protein